MLVVNYGLLFVFSRRTLALVVQECTTKCGVRHDCIYQHHTQLCDYICSVIDSIDDD